MVITFEEMIGVYADQVKLTDGQIPVFGEHTKDIVEIFYEWEHRLLKIAGSPIPSFDEVSERMHFFVEYLAGLGALAAASCQEGGQVVEYGSNLALSSHAYTCITGKPVRAEGYVGSEAIDTTDLAGKLGISGLVTTSPQRTNGVTESRDLELGDVAIVSSLRGGSLDNCMNVLDSHPEFNLILGIPSSVLKDYLHKPEQGEQDVQKFISRYFLQNGYNARVGSPEKVPGFLVFLATPQIHTPDDHLD
jgi:hypothetical protein